MVCEWCGQPIAADAIKCVKCGGTNEKTKPKTEKWEPYFFRGFMIWPEKDFSRDMFTFHIWLGERRIGQFSVTRQMVDAWHQTYGDLSDSSDLIEKMLKLTIGEEEVVRWNGINADRNFMFEIRRTETPEFAEARKIIAEIMAS